MAAPPGPSRRERFAVHSYEVDAFGTLHVPALSGYLQEIAGLHATELGVGLDALRARGLTWVLVRQRLELPGAAVLGDALEIETWPSGIDRLAALREFVVRRADGTEVGRASTQWFVLDLETRRPVRPGEVLDPRFPREPSGAVTAIGGGKLPSLEHWTREKRFHVRYRDIDVNLHVTNASYVEWAIEAAPRELWQERRLGAVEVQYVAEGRYGAAILSRLAPAGEQAWAHAIVREEDGVELARLATAWVPRGATPP